MMLLSGVAGAASPYDLLVKGATVYDGSGEAPFVADVAVVGDRIVAVAPSLEGPARDVIDARGRALAPGFINAMSHAQYSLPIHRTAESDLRQGVTLEVVGEGSTAGPLSPALLAERQRSSATNFPFEWRTLGEFFTGLERTGISVNVTGWVGATTVRRYVLGDDNVQPNAEQLMQMRQLVRQAMEEGALGVASALIYPPGVFASTEELTALATEAGNCGGLYASHLRSEADQFLEALDELLEIARRSGAPATVFHIKAAGQDNWPKLAPALTKIRDARERGLRISANMYPYVAAATGLSATVPPWVQEGGMDAFRARLKDPKIRARVIAEMQQPTNSWENAMRDAGGPSGVVLASFETASLQKFAGKTLADVAKAKGVSAQEAALQLIEAEPGHLGAFYFSMSEDNLRVQLRERYISFGSDLQALTVSKASGVHPRAYGTFARVFAKYVREEKVLSVQEAVRRLTSLPAASYSIAARGWLKPGYFADLVLFDPARIQDHATFERPQQYATGVSDVWVNGVRVLANGASTSARPGRFIRGRGWSGHAGGGCRASASDWTTSP
ncbi:MAG: D-aminoacylase [Steroidobacter sp.]|nr:D-aminoacylase [Steroidobacter sp.]